MVTPGGLYLRADIDSSYGESLDEEATLVGEDGEPSDLVFVDLRTRIVSLLRNLEPLTTAVQDRLHHIASKHRILFRWPWLVGTDDQSHIEAIDTWLTRLTGTNGGEPVLPPQNLVGVIQHRIADKPILRWAHEKPSNQEIYLTDARAIELQALLRRSNAIWEPTTYHYRLPNGEHTDTFIRLADAIQSPQDAYVIACWLTDRLSKDIGIVVDTGGLTPVLIQLEGFLKIIKGNIGPTAILQSYPSGRPIVRRTVEAAITELASGIMGIQSVSSTGSLLSTFTDELERAASSFGLDYTLDILVDRQSVYSSCQKLSQDTDVRAISWLGLGKPSDVKTSSSCELCYDPNKSQCVAVDPRTYGEMTLPSPHLVMPDTSYAEAGQLFWERVQDCRGLAIEANPHEKSRIARGKRTAIPVQPIFEVIVKGCGLENLVKNRKRQLEWPDKLYNTGLVVASASDFATVDLPAFIDGECINLEPKICSVLAGLSLEPNVPIIADDDPTLNEQVIQLPPDKSVLVFSWGSVTGLTLRRLKLAVADVLQSQGMDQSVNGLVFHSRPSSPREWTALKNQFNPGVLCDIWSSCFPWESPLLEEYRLLDRANLDPTSLSESARIFLDIRRQFLNLHSTYSSCSDDWSPRFSDDDMAPHPEHILWGMSNDGLHQERVRGRSLYGKNLNAVTAYAAIGSVVHYTRLNERPKAAPRWVMFDLGRLVRSYFDALIICSIIRWLHPGELWWGGDIDGLDSVRDSIIFLLDQTSDELSEQVILVPELLLACAQGKVPTPAHEIVCERAIKIRDSWQDEDLSLNIARGAIDVGLALLEYE